MDQFWTLAILALSVAFFISGKIRSDIVALCALVGLMVTDILTPEEALSGFSSTVLIMMIGLFVVGGAIFQTGLAKMVSSKLMRFAGTNETRLFVLVIAVTSVIGAMMPMSLALEKTGIASWISNTLASSLGDYSPMLLLAGIYFATSLLTMFISNTATAVLMAPIAMKCALQVGVSPVPLLFAVTLGASLCFASPFATPPNALVMHAGQYRFSDYIKVGLPLQIILGVVMILILPLLFPFS